MTKTALTAADLEQFSGTENWYRHGINPLVTFTDGAKFVADKAGAYWLLDEIALAQSSNRAVACEEFQAWKLKLNENRGATLSCDDGNGKIVYLKQIEYTDFPFDDFVLWYENSVIYLPGER